MNNTITKGVQIVRILFKRCIYSLGVVFLFSIALALTDVPYYLHHRLGRVEHILTQAPEHIILLGGSGMPSPDGLIRCYYAANASQKFPQAKVIIAHPGITNDTTSQAYLMAKELILRGTDSSKIVLELNGYNTYSQIEQICKNHLRKTSGVLLITSPEHMLRSVLCFRKTGLDNISGSAAFTQALSRKQLELKGRHSSSYTFHYDVWSYLNYELLVAREYLALAYYKIHGWI